MTINTPPPNVDTAQGASAGGSNVTGAHVMAQALARHGVTQIFGQSLPSALILAAPHYGIRQVGYRTENGGAAMADAYARISGQVPVVTAKTVRRRRCWCRGWRRR